MDIVATGMVCSVGLSAASACAAMRAQIANFQDLPYVDDRGEPIVGAMVPGLDPTLRRGRRLVELLSPALADCLESGGVRNAERIPLLVGLAEPGRPGGGDTWFGSIIGHVEKKLEVRFDPRRSEYLPKGHTAAFEAVRKARELLQDPAIPACLACGVDSYINARALWWLERDQRLKIEGNSDGVIPGEAAACVLLQRSDEASRLACVTRVIGLGFAQEQESILTEGPLLGLGLAEAGRAALAEAGLPMHEIDFRLSDVTGESYGFREQVLLQARLLRKKREAQPIWHCADSIGDTGAAAGVCHMIRASEAFAKGYAPGEKAMGFASSVPGERAAVVLRRHTRATVERGGPGVSSRGTS